jgi:general L-amino acid transport system ATP-binding protein
MTHSMTTAIKADHICKTYGAEHRALDDVCVDVISGEVLVVMGPSGSGKSTLIRTFNGLEEIDSGELDVLGIKLDNEADPRHVQRIRRRVGMVFQQFNLFPHLSILENITLAPMRVQKQTRVQAEAKARSLLEQMGISEQADKYPAQLSGGQQQRVAIARALALNPEVMLFDEPTSALDPERVKEVLDAMRTLANQGMTMVVVTHELGFAREVADRVLFMDSGRVIESADSKTFFNQAQQERTRKFLNQIN